MENVEFGYCGTHIAIVELHGEHDLGDCEESRRLLEQQLGAHGLLIVDLSEAAFIDSSVLNNLVSVKRTADLHGLSVTLQLGSNTNARRVLEISRLDGFFTSADSREEAIALARNGLGSTAWASSSVRPEGVRLVD
jgi:anti-anti-sigma factor